MHGGQANRQTSSVSVAGIRLFGLDHRVFLFIFFCFLIYFETKNSHFITSIRIHVPSFSVFRVCVFLHIHFRNKRTVTIDSYAASNFIYRMLYCFYILFCVCELRLVVSVDNNQNIHTHSNDQRSTKLITTENCASETYTLRECKELFIAQCSLTSSPLAKTRTQRGHWCQIPIYLRLNSF